MMKNTLNKFTIPHQWRLDNAKEEGFNSDVLIIDNKTTE